MLMRTVALAADWPRAVWARAVVLAAESQRGASVLLVALKNRQPATVPRAVPAGDFLRRVQTAEQTDRLRAAGVV